MATKIKCEVVHPKLNLRVDGKIQRVPIGTILELTEAQLKAFGPKKVVKAGEKKALDLSGSDDESNIGKMEIDEVKAKLDEANIEYAEDASVRALRKLLREHLESQQ